MSYIEYYKEKDTDPMVFLQRFRCTTEPIGGGTEYDEEGELVSWDAAVAAIEIAVKQLGWHPASELPPVNENLISELVLCWCVDPTFGTLEPKLGRVWRGEWCFKDVKWWCYPPKEE